MNYVTLRRAFIKTIFVFITALLLCSFFALDTSAATVNNATGYTNSKSGVVLRKSASTASAKVAVISNNKKVTISKIVFTTKSKSSSKYKWYYVSYSGKKGYIRSDLIDGLKYSAVKGTVTGKVHYRAGAGTSMKSYGTLSKGKSLMIYLPAKAYGSSKIWYLTKLNGSYRYVSGSYVKITGSIFETDKDNSSQDSSGQGGGSSNMPAGSETSDMNESEFKSYLVKQGFPSDYASKLAKLHVKHPNWVFIPKSVGQSFSIVLDKETRDGVSLIEGCQPLSWRDKGINSYKASTAYLYKSASTSTKLQTLSNSQNVTILSETFDKNKVKWTKLKLPDGVTGFTKETVTSQSYPSTIDGKVTSNDVNIRTGAGTGNTIIGSASKNESVKIVLKTLDKDGDVWYKIKRSSGYGYIYSEFVSISGKMTETKTTTVETLSSKYPKVKPSKAVQYYARPDSAYPVLGKLIASKEYTVVSQVKDSKSKVWYKLYLNGKLVYVQSESVTISSKPQTGTVPSSVSGTTTDALNYRVKAGTTASVIGTFAKGASVSIYGVTEVSGQKWFKVKVGTAYYYASSDYISVKLETAPSDAAPTVKTQTTTATADADPAKLTGSGKISISSGTYIAKDGSNWFNASRDTVAYFLDPRNFLDETRIYMFEDLSYHPEYHTVKATGMVLSGSKLPGCGFTADLFVNAGKKYSISPIHLASRARQETGGGSDTISGVKYNGKVVYNPFNIGAYSSGNPVRLALKYAYNAGWTTQAKAVNGGADFLAAGYISKGQNSSYLQKWNVLNGASSIATHQYMTNIMAPYYEAQTTKSSYSSYGITNESLTFVIPVYSSMPSSTSLPD